VEQVLPHIFPLARATQSSLLLIWLFQICLWPHVALGNDPEKMLDRNIIG
jgi:hypothetical protein